MHLSGLSHKSYVCPCLLLLVLFSSVHSLAYSSELFKLPSLAIDAERSTYQGIISRSQDNISQETIELRQTSNPIELLRSTNPSITGSHSLLGAIFTPSLRGFSGLHTKVLLDGAPLNTPWNNTSSLSGFPIRRLKKVIVEPGGSALIYGPNTVAGAINLVLPTASDLEGLTIQQEVGGHGSRHQEFIYGNLAHQNEHLFALFMDEHDKNVYYKTHGFGNSRLDNRLFMYRGRIETDNNFIIKATIMESQGTLSLPNYMQRFEPWEMSHQDFVIEKDFANNQNMVLRFLKYRDYSADQLYTDYTLQVANGGIDGETTIDMRTMEALYNFSVGEKHYLTIGAQQQKIRDVGHGVKEGISGKWHDTKGFFISDSINPSEDLALHLVARSDESYESDSKSAWSAGANFSLNSASSFGVSVSRTLRFPNIQELYRSSRIFGNQKLSPEVSDNLEFRFAHTIKNNWETVITRFDSKIDNLITSFKAPVDTFVNGVGAVKAGNSYYDNIEKSDIGGWELGINGRINDYFETWANYVRFDVAKDTTNMLRLVARPDYRATLGTTFKKNDFSALLSFEHQGPTKETTSGGTVYAPVNSSTCVNLGMRKKVRDDFTLYLNVDNLTNKEDIILIQASDTKNPAGLLTDPLYYKEGRIVSFGFELSF